MAIPRFKPSLDAREIFAFLADSAFRSGDPGLVDEFEREFASWIGGGAAVFTPSGRSALYFLLKALRYPAGSEIIVPAFTFQAVPAVVLLAGLSPVFADIDPRTFEITAESVEKVLSPRTAAVIATHLFGRTCPVAEIARICRSHGVDLLEDCAQACGALLDYGVSEGSSGVISSGQALSRQAPDDREHSLRVAAGSGGTASFFTFGVTKNFTAFGCGLAFCRDGRVAGEVRASVEKLPAAPARSAVFSALKACAMKFATGRAAFSAIPAPLLRLTGDAASARSVSTGAATRHDPESASTRSVSTGAATRRDPESASARSVSDDPAAGPDALHRMFEEPPLHPDAPAAFEATLRRPRSAHAAAGIRQLVTIEARTAARREAGAALRAALEQAGATNLPAPPEPDGDHIYVSFPILRDHRFEFAAFLRSRGVDTSPGYMSACSREPSLGGAPGLCPGAETAADSIIHLPLYPSLTGRDIERVARAVSDGDRFFRNRNRPVRRRLTQENGKGRKGDG